MTEEIHPEVGSFADKLGIDKSAEWMHSMVDKSYEIFNENPGDFAGLTMLGLGKSVALFALLGTGNEVVTLSRLFFTLGFMKGICFSEQTARLNDLAKEVTKGGVPKKV